MKIDPPEAEWRSLRSVLFKIQTIKMNVTIRYEKEGFLLVDKDKNV